MASEIVLKHFQIFRNETIGSYSTYANALTAAKAVWTSTFVADKKLKDGEFVLFNYKLTGSEKVESILGIVRSSAIDIIGSYDQLTTEYKAYVDSAIKDLDGSATIATVDNGVVKLKAGIAETDGKIANNTGADITLAKVATTGAAADVAVATDIEGLTANNVQGALAELAGSIAAIDPSVTTVVEGTGIKVTDAAGTGNDHAYTVAADFTVDTFKYGEGAGDKAGKTYIRIMDGETIISETDADAFVKDGFLTSVTKDATTNELVFTWNTDAEAGEANQITRIAIKDLCDVYTVGEGLVTSADGYTFSHQAGATVFDTTKSFGSGSATANKITVKVPSVTVDKFGHVSALTENEVSLEIPASVASAVQTVTKPENEKYLTINRNVNDVTISTVTQTMAGVAGEGAEDGLATALDVKTYVDGKITNVNNAIAALDVDPFSLTTLNGNKLEGYQISEVDGKIVKGETANTLLTFVSAPTTDNKVATQAEIAALDAEVTSPDGTNVQVKVTEVDGKITAVNVTDNSVNANDVTTAITNAIAGLESEVENETGDIKVKVKQVNGELTAVTVTDTLKDVAHSGAAADVAIVDEGNLYTAGNVEGALAEVMTKANALDAAQLSAGNGISITDKKINSDFTVTIENIPESEGVTAGTYIVIKGKGENGQEITKVNANSFVKDGFLQSVVLDDVNGELVFTWNTDAEAGEENQVTKIAISELCDVYTAKENDWIQLNSFEFSHKIVADLDSTNVHGITEAVTVNSTDTKNFQVPTLKVDAAGHVVSVDEQTVTITLPAEIDTAIQGGAGVNTTYITTTVARNTTNTNQLDVTATAVIGDYAAEGQVDGLATTSATKTYVDSVANTAIANLYVENVSVATETDGIVTFNGIKQEDGKIATGTPGISLAKVATTGAAGDMSIEDTSNKFEATTVEGALLELVNVDTWDAGTY